MRPFLTFCDETPNISLRLLTWKKCGNIIVAETRRFTKPPGKDHTMKNIIAFIMALAIFLGGCSQLTPAATTAPATEAPTETTVPATTIAVDHNPAMEAYQAALMQLCVEHLWPDGSELEMMNDFGYMKDNTFAIADVDGDGSDELLVSFTTAPTAGMLLRIYRYDAQTDSLKELFLSFPAAVFYSDGLIRCDASHNQSMSMDFWPYSLYRYNSSSDTFELKYAAEGWQQEICPQDYSGNDFPTEKADGQGMVYLVTRDQAQTVMSPKEFEEYEKEAFSGATELSVNWQSMDVQNIKAIKTE